MGIPVEICPTSNVQATRCGSAEHLQHLREFRKHEDAHLAVGADGTLVFQTDLTNELFLFAKATGMRDKEEIEGLIKRSAKAAFLDGVEL